MKPFPRIRLILAVPILYGAVLWGHPAQANIATVSAHSSFSVPERFWVASVNHNATELEMPIQPMSLFEQGVEQAGKGNFQAAIRNYDLALKQSPQSADIYYNRGVARYSVGQSAEAIQDFSHAIQLNPSLAEAYGNRGAIRMQQGDRQGAIQDYREATRLFTQQGNAVAAEQMQELIQQSTTPAPSH